MPQVSIYDEVAFPSYPYPQSHPERLATMARLCGLTTTELENCRVLELGCGAGGNILPMAESMPRGEFLGIDLSPEQIAIGNTHIAAAGLGNVRLEARDILHIDAAIGQFDYVIAHGVFSWTTEPVQEKILAICRELLTPNGVAYINYNTYPGWHVQGMLRDMLYLHSQSFVEPAVRVREARRMIDFLYQTMPASATPLGNLVRSELDAIRQNSDPFLFHAYLNVLNRPLYLSEFQRRVTAHGLRYLGDADPDATWPERVVPQMRTQLKQLTPDEFRWPQYVDFVRFTASRRSIVCHQEVPIERGPCLSALRDLHVSAPLRRAEASQTPTAFITTGGRSISSSDPIMQQTLQLLADAWPESMPFSVLVRQLETLGASQPSQTGSWIESWQDELLHAFCNRVVGLSIRPSLCSKSIAQVPLASALARFQAMHLEFVANRRHEAVQLNDRDKRCLALLDGTRTIEQLFQQLGGDSSEVLRRLSTAGLLIDSAE